MKTCHVPALLILTLFANRDAFDFPMQRAIRRLSILPRRIRPMLMPAVVLCAFCFAELIPSASHAGESNPAVGPGSVIVHSKFGGQIFGFDIDPNGKDGILNESLSLPDGNYLAAAETFDQTTGEIIKVISMTKSQDDFVTLGVFNSVGLIESEHVVGFLDVRRKFHSIAPLDANDFTGVWTPPIDQEHLVAKVSGVLTRVGGARVASGSAVYVIDNSGSFTPLVFTSDVRSNTFGPEGQVRALFAIYGLGFSAIAVEILLLNLRAWRLRGALRLNDHEKSLTRRELFGWSTPAAVGLTSLLLALTLPGEYIQWSGWVYMSMAFLVPLQRRWNARSRARAGG
jgi:hypothetical protein